MGSELNLGTTVDTEAIRIAIEDAAAALNKQSRYGLTSKQ